MRTNLWSEDVKGRDHSEDLTIDGEILLEWMSGKFVGNLWTGVIWLGRNQWRSSVNTIMNLRVE